MSDHPADMPRSIDTQRTFDELVNWVHDELIVKKQAPGFVIGISGTDSILAFMVCAKAFEKAGHPERVVGIHYGEPLPPPEKLVELNRQIPSAFWFQQSVVPWLKQFAPNASVIVNSSIDHKKDGQRWGALLDWSVVGNPETGTLRPAGKNYWVVGTRNATEQMLGTYSNVSTAASVQPLTHLWKSDVLRICRQLGVPQSAITYSQDVDCACGRGELAAINIENVDALLMARQGKLSRQYVEQNIPTDLRRRLEEYIDEQMRASAFKQQIPYVAPIKCVKTEKDEHAAAFAAAKLAAKEGTDTKAISKIVPHIISTGNANAACDLVCGPAKKHDSWLPEALTLFGTANLTGSQKKRMIEVVFDRQNPMLFNSLLASCCARIGNYGFSFPKWRFLSQRFGDETSLVEQYGMTRLNRATDVRDPSLPPADPNRDLLGTGFSWHDDQWYVEYRRGYLVCSNRSAENPATLIVRNSSYFFGRDRLAAPAYISFDRLTPEEIQAITPESIETSGRFSQWQNFVHSTPNAELTKKLKTTDSVIKYLDGFDKGLNNWLRSTGPTERVNGAGPDHSASGDTGGAPALTRMLKRKTAGPVVAGRPPLFLGLIPDHAAPWHPKTAIPLTSQTADQIAKPSTAPTSVTQLLNSAENMGSELVLLSGVDGDFPVLPDKQTTVRSASRRPAAAAKR